MNINAVRWLLRDECAKHGGAAEFARAAGVSRQLVYAVLSGQQSPRGKILDALGIEVVTEYRRKRSADLPVKRPQSDPAPQIPPE
jgi:hypothetical protein